MGEVEGGVGNFVTLVRGGYPEVKVSFSTGRSSSIIAKKRWSQLQHLVIDTAPSHLLLNHPLSLHLSLACSGLR